MNQKNRNLDKYDFDTIINREHSDSIKWNQRVMKTYIGGENLLPMWVADMDFKAPQPVLDALHQRVNHGVFGYMTPTKTYIRSIQNWFTSRHNWKINKKWLKFTPGIVPAINFLIDCFTKPGDKIIIQEPVYYPFKASIKNNGRIPLINELQLQDNSYHINFEEFESLAQEQRVKLFILCSPHNPVGRVWTREELIKLGKICLENNILIIADEIHCDLILPGHKHIPYASISGEFAQNSITCTAPTKTFNLAGLNVSTLIIPNSSLKREFDIHMDKLAIHTPNIFGAVALQTAYMEGEEWLDAVLHYIHQNILYFTEQIEDRLSGVKVIPPEGTYLVWVNFNNTGLEPEKIDQIIKKKAKIGLDRGNMFGKSGLGFQRFNLACPRSVVEEALDRLEKAFKPILKKN